MTDRLAQVAMMCVQGACLLILLAVILFAVSLVWCFFHDGWDTPAWAKISGGIITFAVFATLIGWWLP